MTNFEKVYFDGKCILGKRMITINTKTAFTDGVFIKSLHTGRPIKMQKINFISGI